MRDWKVTILYRGKYHELIAKATTTEAALDGALKEQRALRQAVKRGEASWEVRTV
jgi:hypothetical protein